MCSDLRVTILYFFKGEGKVNSEYGLTPPFPPHRSVTGTGIDPALIIILR